MRPMKGKLLRNSPIVRFMLHELEKAGCPFTEEHLQCVQCNSTRAGAFCAQHGVLLCQNQLVSKTHMEDAITDEFIHAFDHCTIKWTGRIVALSMHRDQGSESQWRLQIHTLAPEMAPRCLETTSGTSGAGTWTMFH
ncbi:peptidase M76 family-domain-containing protein [Cladochytrium replicatum]|nr:peptidase M76 family-domain-containing protein [Cladochytrium replicatum]